MRRWSDNQKVFGPFLYSRDAGHKPLGIVLDSGHDEYPGCSLRMRGFGHTFIINLPQIVRPWRRWVDTSGHEWSNPAGGYWDEHANEYGFNVSDGFLQVFYGAQTHDSTTTKSWGYFLPWQSWRMVRHSLYGLSGEHIWSQYNMRGMERYEELRLATEQTPKAIFRFTDYDGEEIKATTHIEEREWLRGEKWCKWLSVFFRPMIRRSLDIAFSSEVGPRKGSWKGGTLGHGIDMLPGELHEAAFKRYCAENNLAFIGN